jgi:hypothetical protein
MGKESAAATTANTETVDKADYDNVVAKYNALLEQTGGVPAINTPPDDGSGSQPPDGGTPDDGTTPPDEGSGEPPDGGTPDDGSNPDGGTPDDGSNPDGGSGEQFMSFINCNATKIIIIIIGIIVVFVIIGWICKNYCRGCSPLRIVGY